MKRILKRIMLTAVVLGALWIAADARVDRHFTLMSMMQKWRLSREVLSEIEVAIATGKVDAVQCALQEFNLAAPKANHHEFNNLLAALSAEIQTEITNEQWKTGDRPSVRGRESRRAPRQDSW